MRVGVIGLGSMGRNHARVFDELGVLAAVCDSDRSVRPGRSDVDIYRDYRVMLEEERLDAISVAVPTLLHHEVGKAVIEAGIPVLIEKPLAATSVEAEDLIASNARGVFLAVGFIERFNPAIAMLKERWEQLGVVSQIIIRRMGPMPERVLDTGVILDLSVHDFDLVRYLTGSEMDCMAGLSSQTINEKKEDSAICIGRMKSGALVTLIHNWTTPTKIRDITVHGERGMFHVDLLMQDLTFYENDYTAAEWRELSVFRGVSEGDHIQYHIERKEPLKQELIAFLEGVDGKTSNSVSGRDGLFALRLAERLQCLCEQNGKEL